jgi:hypothetical protein
MLFSRQQNPTSKATRVDGIVTGAFLALCAAAVSQVSVASENVTGQLALIYLPWTSGSEALAQASGSDADLVGLGRYPFIVIVAPRSPSHNSGARPSGAILTLAANGFGGCLKASAKVSS